MGNLCSGNNENSGQNKKVNEQMNKLKEELDKNVKFLLLGTGESGKSYYYFFYFKFILK